MILWEPDDSVAPYEEDFAAPSATAGTGGVAAATSSMNEDASNLIACRWNHRGNPITRHLPIRVRG